MSWIEREICHFQAGLDYLFGTCVEALAWCWEDLSSVERNTNQCNKTDKKTLQVLELDQACFKQQTPLVTVPVLDFLSDNNCRSLEYHKYWDNLILQKPESPLDCFLTSAFFKP
jgi:hypothetical protein